LHIERDTTADAYIVRIHLRRDVDPAAVEVRQRGRGVLIRASRYNQSNYRNDQTSGYRSYSYSYSSSMSRRFTLPRDADVSAMKRQDEQGMVTLTFPRKHRH
jgi:HSP20 family molecular chaperone IbpA